MYSQRSTLQFKGIPNETRMARKRKRALEVILPFLLVLIYPFFSSNFLLITLFFLWLLSLFPFCTFSILPPSLFSLSLSLSFSYFFNFSSLFSAIPFSLSLFRYLHPPPPPFKTNSPIASLPLFSLIIFSSFLSFARSSSFFFFCTYSVTSCSFIHSTSFIFL